MYRIVWEFDAQQERLEQFQQVYGPQGLWAKFFRISDDYIGTELFKSVSDPCRFVTLDKWRSRVAYENFRKSHSDEYAKLDDWCARLRVHERTLGVTDDGKV